MTGTYISAAQARLRGASRTLPCVTNLLVQLVHHFVPHAVFTALAVFADFYGSKHVDQHND